VAGPAADAWDALRDAWSKGEELPGEGDGGPASAALAARAAAARAAVQALLVHVRSGAVPAAPFLAGLTPREATDARGLIRARLALAGLVVDDFERARRTVGEVVRGLPRGLCKASFVDT
jgi:hypothetical protein